MSDAEELAYESAHETAMQILHGGILSGMTGTLPTAEDLANLIKDKTDLVWLQSIRLTASSVKVQTSTGKHCHECEHYTVGDHEWCKLKQCYPLPCENWKLKNEKPIS